MKIRRTFPALLMLLLAITMATTQSSSATAPDNGSSAFGQGGFNFLVFRDVPRVENWGFSFDVMANKKGNARGRAIFDISSGQDHTQVVVKINCLEVRGSSGAASAVMTGIVLHSDNPNYPKRAEVVFAAEDNNNSPFFHFDIITPMFVIFEGFEGDCHDIGPPLAMFQQGIDAITIEP